MATAGEAIDDDDYVIKLLQKDAEANQKRYITSGLGSLPSTRPRGNAPKPNTRFLRNVLREADSHNAALKAKEDEESRAKLRQVREDGTGGKRRRDEDGNGDAGSAKRRRGEEKAGRWASVLSGMGRGEAGRERKRRAGDGRSEEQSSRGADSRRKRSEERQHAGQSRRRVLDESRHPHSRNRSPRHRKERRRRSRSPVTSEVGDTLDQPNNDSDSDPLNDIIGPKPPPNNRPRGRGALKSSADTMDARFDPSYDPKSDVNLEPDEDRDDWDMALEALRDRAKWRAQGGDRLRAAGFTDEEIQKWKKGDEKGVEDVRWRKRGEGREWDRGKLIDEKGGTVEVRAEWALLQES